MEGYSLMKRVNILKISIPLNQSMDSLHFHSKSQHFFFFLVETKKLILEFTRRIRGHKRAKTIFKKDKVEIQTTEHQGLT